MVPLYQGLCLFISVKHDQFSRQPIIGTFHQADKFISFIGIWASSLVKRFITALLHLWDVVPLNFLLKISRMEMTLEENPSPKRITTALLLAAGTGSRLLPLTHNSPKCLTLVNEISILGRLVENLRLQSFKRLVVVTGYLNAAIEDFLGTTYHDMIIEYVHSPFYKTTNNIYSLWIARNIIKEPFLLLESDLVFDHSLLSEMIYPDRLAVAGIRDWMNGTTVTIDVDQKVMEFKNDTTVFQNETKYKTVNIYSFSLDSWKTISKRLDLHINDGKVNGYYETVFSELVNEGILSFQAVSFDKKAWYEIDTVGDLTEAVKLFPIVSTEKALTKTLAYEIA